MCRMLIAVVTGLSCVGWAAVVAQTIDVGRGDIQLRVPSNSGPDAEMALVVLLHGYSHTGRFRESEWRFGDLVDQYGFVLAYPDGTRESGGDKNQFWNASDTCCNFFGSDVDDSTYIVSIVQGLTEKYNIDRKRIYLIGHSNGGFMSYRAAYDHSETFAAIVSVAGAATITDGPALPHPVHVLQIHGTIDSVIAYEGGDIRDNTNGKTEGRPYPGAVETVERWAIYNGCAVEGRSGRDRDLDKRIAGAETTGTQYIKDCRNGGSSELWTIAGGSHSPDISETFSQQIVEWLLDHPKP